MIQLNANHVWYLIAAAQWTVLLSLIAFAGGALVGLPLALMRVSPSPALRTVAGAYIQLIQGTPLLILLFLTYFGLGIVETSSMFFAATPASRKPGFKPTRGSLGSGAATPYSWMFTGCQSWNVISPSIDRLATQPDPESCWPPHTRYGNELSVDTW